MSNKEQLIEYLLENGKDMSWVALADKFGICPNGDNKRKSDSVRIMWKRHCKSHKTENFVEEANISKVKRWQLADGTWRESIHYSDNPSESDILEKIKTHFKGYKAPKEFKHKTRAKQKKCAIINLFDAHIDKLCLVSEANEDSSIEKNLTNFEAAFDELFEQCLLHEPEVIYLPIGNDFFNTNDLGQWGSTKRGTPQAILGNAEDNFTIGIKAYRRCVDKIAQHTNVICPIIKGNHDEDKVFYLGVALEIAYEHNPNVIIDNTRHQRKYYTYGKNLFGFAHGDKEKGKIQNLPLLMAEEQKEAWAQTTYREWYLGDIHHKQEFKFLRGKDFIGCMVRFLRSVGTSDKWHYDSGYLGIPKTAEAFIWTLDDGMKANFQTHI